VAEGCRNLERIGPRYGPFARCCRACSSLPTRGFAPGLANWTFFDASRAKLAGEGVLVINLAGDPESYAGLLNEAMDVFDDQVIVFPVPEDGNHILLAFRNPRFEPRWRNAD
jgi:spermidine synthase